MILLFAIFYTLTAIALGGWWWLAAGLLWIVWLAGKIVDARTAYYRARFTDTPVYSLQDPDQES